MSKSVVIRQCEFILKYTYLSLYIFYFHKAKQKISLSKSLPIHCPYHCGNTCKYFRL